MHSLPYYRSYMHATLLVSSQTEPGTDAPNRVGCPINRIHQACRLPAIKRFFIKLQMPVIGSHPESSGVIFDSAESLPIPAGGRRPSLRNFCFIRNRPTEAPAHLSPIFYPPRLQPSPPISVRRHKTGCQKVPKSAKRRQKVPR